MHTAVSLVSKRGGVENASTRNAVAEAARARENLRAKEGQSVICPTPVHLRCAREGDTVVRIRGLTQKTAY